MKLLRLRIKNLNSFRSEIELDFENKPLNGSSLIAITGPTGAGKTTLLDAVCVALYNKTPRLLGGKLNKNPGNLLSQGKTEGFAEALFEAEGKRYLAEWRIKRNSKGELKAEAKLIEPDTGIVITDRLSSRGESRDTSDMSLSKVVESILGLDFNAFNRSVMLAQGDFAAFLKAKPEERRGILEATTGIGVYDQLKQALNRKVVETEQTFNQHQGILEAIPDVTDEEMEKARNDLEEKRVNTHSLQGERAKILEEKRGEEERERLFDQLTQAEMRQAELLEQRKEIDLQQSELELAQSAARLVPAQTKFRDEKKEYETIEEELGKVNDSLAFAQAEYDESQRSFAEIDEAYRDLLSNRDARMKVYGAARDEETRANTQLEAVEARTEELETIEKRIEELSETANLQGNEKAALEKDIEEDNSFLRESTLPENCGECRIQAHEILQKRRGKSESRNEKMESIKDWRSKIAKLTDELEESEIERERRIKKKQVADAKLARIQSELGERQNEDSVETWQAQKRKAQEMQPIAIEFEENRRLLNAERNELKKRCDGLMKSANEFATLSRKLAIQTEAVDRAEKRVERLDSEKDFARALNHIADLRGKLHDGQPCPVCGSMKHPWREKTVEEIEEQLKATASNLSVAQKEFQVEEKKYQDLEQERVRVEANQLNLAKQIDESHTKIESLNEIIDSAQGEWKRTYPQNEISLKWMQQLIETADDSIRKLQEEREASKDQKRSAESLNEQEHAIQRLGAELAGVKSQKSAISAEAEALEDEIEALDADFHGILPDDLREADQEEALNQFAARIDEVEARSEGLNKKRDRLGQLEVEIKQNVKNHNDERERRSSAVTEIERLRTEAEQLSKSARAKTEGLTAEDAINALETETSEQTERREQNQKALREKENVLTQARTKANDLKSRHEACAEKFHDAQRKYLEALESSDFESPEAHEAAFRDQAWIKECDEKINEYKQELRAINEDVEKLRPKFVDLPFDPEIVERLKKAERGIDEKIELANQQVGELRENVKKLEENIRKRDAQKNALEKSRQERDRWARLQERIPHNSLRDFALERMFDAIILFANQQLADLTKRYELRAEGIDDMVVIDRWNGNEERPVETLSGGEAFLTSLSLALALSEMSRGRTKLNSLYLDEGFGTLDSQTLDIAISALEGLRLAGRTVVVISHVVELTRRIPVRIAVEKMGSGSSKVRIQG